MITNNTRYQTDSRTSTFNLHTLFTRFVDDFGKEGMVNLLENPTLTDKFLISSVPGWPGWDKTDFVSFTQPDERFLIEKSSAPANETLRQDITSKILPGRTYTVIFKGVIEQDTLIDVVGGPFDLLNPDDLTEVGSSTVSIVGSANEIYTAFRFQTAEVLSGSTFYLRFRPSEVNTYIRFDQLILKEGWIEVNDLFRKSMLENSTRYNETTEVWEITSDGGASWETFGTSVSGDIYTAIADMVVSNVENGIQVTYTSGDKKLNFDVADFTLTFDGDVSGAGTITNLGNQTITISVTDDSHNHTIAFVTDFDSGVNAIIDSRINDVGTGSTDLWSAEKISGEISSINSSLSTIDLPLVGTVEFWSPMYFANGSNGTPVHALIATNDINGVNDYLAINKPNWRVADGTAYYHVDSPIWDDAGLTKHLPNLTDSRFLIGGTGAGSIGGTNDGHYHTHTLNGTATSAGAHEHIMSTNWSGGGVGNNISGDNWASFDNNWNPSTNKYTQTGGAHTHPVTISGNIGNVAGIDGGAANSNMPKYFSGFYIIKVK